MKTELTLLISLQNPPPGVDYGLQKGKGSVFEIVQKQRSVGSDLHFECKVDCKQTKDGKLNLSGPFVQGPPPERFLYIGIGRFAGQEDTPWSRRLKIPLSGIEKDMVKALAGSPQTILQTRVPGTGKDGSPSCATVKPFKGWKPAKPQSGTSEKN
jgi:hypothetical protein